MSCQSESSSNSDGELERLKAAVCGPKLGPLMSTPAFSSNKGRSTCKNESTTTKQLAVSRDTQKFLARKLSKYLDSQLDAVPCTASHATGSHATSPQSEVGYSTSVVKLFRNSKRPLDPHLKESSDNHRKDKLPLCCSKLHNESSESEGEEEKLKLSEVAIDPEIIKKQRLA